MYVKIEATLPQVAENVNAGHDQTVGYVLRMLHCLTLRDCCDQTHHHLLRYTIYTATSI